MTPMVPQSPHLCGQCRGRQPAGMCLERLISITGPIGILEGAGSLASLPVGVMQIAEFGFNLFADEHPSPEMGGGGVHNLVLLTEPSELCTDLRQLISSDNPFLLDCSSQLHHKTWSRAQAEPLPPAPATGPLPLSLLLSASGLVNRALVRAPEPRPRNRWRWPMQRHEVPRSLFTLSPHWAWRSVRSCHSSPPMPAMAPTSCRGRAWPHSNPQGSLCMWTCMHMCTHSST